MTTQQGPKVLVGVVGQYPVPQVDWPAGWPVPREGDSVSLIEGDLTAECVRTVVWYPQGEDDDGEATEPFVYVVIGPKRR